MIVKKFKFLELAREEILVKKFFSKLTVKLYLVNMWSEKILIVKEVEDNVPLEWSKEKLEKLYAMKILAVLLDLKMILPLLDLLKLYHFMLTMHQNPMLCQCVFLGIGKYWKQHDPLGGIQ